MNCGDFITIDIDNVKVPFKVVEKLKGHFKAVHVSECDRHDNYKLNNHSFVLVGEENNSFTRLPKDKLYETVNSLRQHDEKELHKIDNELREIGVAHSILTPPQKGNKMRKIVVMSTALAASDEWFEGLTKQQQKDYIEKHPKSKFAKQNAAKHKAIEKDLKPGSKLPKVKVTKEDVKKPVEKLVKKVAVKKTDVKPTKVKEPKAEKPAIRIAPADAVKKIEALVTKRKGQLEKATTYLKDIRKKARKLENSEDKKATSQYNKYVSQMNQLETRINFLKDKIVSYNKKLRSLKK